MFRKHSPKSVPFVCRCVRSIARLSGQQSKKALTIGCCLKNSKRNISSRLSPEKEMRYETQRTVFNLYALLCGYSTLTQRSFPSLGVCRSFYTDNLSDGIITNSLHRWNGKNCKKLQRSFRRYSFRSISRAKNSDNYNLKTERT